MSSLPTTTQRYGQQSNWNPKSILLTSTIFLSGGFAGLFFSTVLFFGQVHNDLASMNNDLSEAKATIAELTDTKDTARRTNSLLDELNRQELKLVQAKETVRSLRELEKEAQLNTAHIAQARQQLEEVGLLFYELQLAGDQIQTSLKQIDKIDQLQSELASQDISTYYSMEAVNRLRALNQQLLAVSAEEDALHGALSEIDQLGQRIQEVSSKADDASLAVDDLDRLIDRHRDLGAELPGLEWDVDTMFSIIRRVAEQKTRISQARETAREMSSLCDFVNGNSVAIDSAKNSLAGLENLDRQVDDVAQEVDEMVEAFRLVQGMNEAIHGVLISSDRLRHGLAEMMLLEPAIERVVNDWTHIQSRINPEGLMSQEAIAKKIIESQNATRAAEGSNDSESADLR